MGKAKSAGASSSGLVTVILGLLVGAVVYVIMFGGTNESTSAAGRIPIVDAFLIKNAKYFTLEPGHTRQFLNQALELARQASDDPESINVYASLVDVVLEDGISALPAEWHTYREDIKYAKEQKNKEKEAHALKELAITEVFIEAALGPDKLTLLKNSAKEDDL